jgi:Protein of unknown function (DUF2975)
MKIKKGSTVFLRLALIVLGLMVLGFCIILFFGLEGEGIRNVPYWERILTPLVLMMYLSAIPFYIALFQSWKLLGYIDHNIAFSELSAQALKNIKHCAFTVSVIYVATLPDFFRLAEADDAPGVVVVGFIFMGASLTVAIFAAVLEKLVESAIEIKSENDLTV